MYTAYVIHSVVSSFDLLVRPFLPLCPYRYIPVLCNKYGVHMAKQYNTNNAYSCPVFLHRANRSSKEQQCYLTTAVVVRSHRKQFNAVFYGRISLKFYVTFKIITRENRNYVCFLFLSTYLSITCGSLYSAIAVCLVRQL